MSVVVRLRFMQGHSIAETKICMDNLEIRTVEATMTDFDYDVHLKKQIARGYRNKKNGSKSRRCPLPSDSMTPKQWKARNGDVMSYQLSAPMTWSMLKAMPQDLQKEYITNLRDKYGTTATDLSKFLGVTPSTVTKHCKEELGIVFAPGQRMTKAQRTSFSEFLGETTTEGTFDGGDAENENATDPCLMASRQAAKASTGTMVIERSKDESETDRLNVSGEPMNDEVPRLNVCAMQSSFRMKDLTMSFSGNFDADALRNSLLVSIGQGTPVKLDITCSVLC